MELTVRTRYEKVSDSGPEDLEKAAALLRGRSDRTSELLADVFEQWAWIGDLNLDMLNRTGGPETVRLARHLIEEKEE